MWSVSNLSLYVFIVISFIKQSFFYNFFKNFNMISVFIQTYRKENNKTFKLKLKKINGKAGVLTGNGRNFGCLRSGGW